ncbi:MAG: NUDIX hydrolase [Bosea sp. (in: a-proteobacteria)]
MSASEQRHVTRHTSRLIILDPADRLLLIQYRATERQSVVHPGLKDFWFTPGGGIEPGESAEEAALREMDEEVGLSGLPLLGEVARRDALNDLFTRAAFCHERYFLVRASSAAFDTARLAETDQDEVLDVRWWELDAFKASSEVLIPGGVLALVGQLILQGIPPEPVDLAALAG